MRRNHSAKLMLWAVCLAFALGACSREGPEKFIASGKEFLGKHDYRAAIIEFKNAVQKDPANAEARYWLGLSLTEDGDPRAGEIELRKAAEGKFSPQLVYPALVRNLQDLGEFDKAIREADEHQRDNPAKAELVALAGAARLSLGKVEDARADFLAALNLDPSNDTATLGMAKEAAIERDLARAKQLVDQVLQRSPSSREALILQADVLLAQNQGKEAAQAYEKALELRPHSVRVYLSLVPLLVRENQLDAAKAKVDALKKFAGRSPVTLYLEALVAYNQGNVALASDSIDASLKGMPDYVPALLLAGVVHYGTGNYAQAEESLRKVVSAAPKAPYPRRLLISTYLRSGQLERAQEASDALLALAPNDSASLSLAGEVALATRQLAKAGEYYEKALALNPNSAAARTRLGQTRLFEGDAARGIEALEQASATDATQYQADVALVVVHLRRKEIEKAQQAADTLLKKQPKNPLAYNLSGLLHLTKKDEAGARKDFEHALELNPTFFPAVQNLANLDLLSGKTESAKQRYEAILAKDPKQVQALLALVDVLQKTGASTTEMEKTLDRAVASNPSSAMARVAKVNYLLMQGDYTKALSAAQQAQAALPQDVQVLNVLGHAQLAAGKTDQAIASFGKLATLAPKSAAPLLALGQAYAAAKDWAGAHRTIQKAVALQPDLIQPRLGLVRIEVQMGRFNDARGDARTIQKRWPMNPAGFVAEAEVLVAQKEFQAAERVLREGIEKTKSPALVMALYGFLNDRGQSQDAEAAAQAWMKKNPKDVTVNTFAAQLSMRRKDYTAAARWYKDTLKIYPDSVATLNNLAWVLGQLQDPMALEYGEKALALAPTAPAVMDTVGWLYVEKGDVARGLELLNGAHSRAPAVPSIELNLAKALIKAGQKPAARGHLEALAKLPPDTPARKEAEKLLATL